MACTCGKCQECDWARSHPSEDAALRQTNSAEQPIQCGTFGGKDVRSRKAQFEQAEKYLDISNRLKDHYAGLFPDCAWVDEESAIALMALARMAGEYKRLYHEICGPMLTRCRASQDAEHGGPAHDDTHTPAEWAEFIRKFAGRAEYQGQFQDNAEAIARYQKCMIDVAGLAISAVLSSQRKVCGESA